MRERGDVFLACQTRWRWLDLGGAAGFSLVNVTARNKSVLERQVQRMLKTTTNNAGNNH